MKIQTNKQFTLQSRDFWRGLIQAVGTVVITLLLEQLESGLGYDWGVTLNAAIGAALTYLLRNFFEPTKVVAVAEDDIDKQAIKRL